MGSQETALIKNIQMQACVKGGRLFRNSVGLAWQGNVCEERVLRDKSGSLVNVVELSNARRVNYGLCKGSSDLIGWTPVIITADMVGQTIAVFTSVEVKTKAYKKITDEQENWLYNVCIAGGLAYVAKDGKEGLEITKIT